MMTRLITERLRALFAFALAILGACSADAVPFQTGHIDGGSWSGLFAQGFSPSIRANPDRFVDPGLDLAEIVPLSRMRFFKSGYIDPGTAQELIAEDVQLAIVSNFFVNLSTFTTSSPELVGLSTNTIASTAPIANGAALDFYFPELPLTYGADYAAIFVNNNAGNLSVVQTPVLIANYIETPEGSGVYRPTSDYGDPDLDFVYSASGFRTGDYLNTFNAPYADANFIASFDLQQPAGDYNGDDVVDAADYTVWRDVLGQSVQLPNEGPGVTPGLVTVEDYNVWRSAYGSSASASSIVAVPEPSACLSGLAAVSLSLASRRVRNTSGRVTQP